MQQKKASARSKARHPPVFVVFAVKDAFTCIACRLLYITIDHNPCSIEFILAEMSTIQSLRGTNFITLQYDLTSCLL